ncbi:PucC family protein [Salinarimonas chemoclinalis]|uniref:PucC family protein n=1 Tax=Salinarimonas chemoclinalis TaxID=3241599 RepID=UPI0035579CBB
MNLAKPALSSFWTLIGTRFLPFADAATRELPLSRLLRLSLFQVSVGMAIVLLNGTLNRVMILELNVPAWLVASMIALPVLFAPVRALIGHRSDHHRSLLGWKRVPYIWFGSLLQFGGLAIMPFALLVLSGDGQGPVWVGQLGAGLAFLLVGAGLHTTQTAGLALATDLAPEDTRPRVVAFLYVMLLVGMVASAFLFSVLLEPYSHLALIQVVQGAAVVTMVLNAVALWKQEARDPSRTRKDVARPAFRESWAEFVAGGRATRTLVAVGLGTAGFSMQDILLEPYGGEALGMSVAATTALTAFLAGGSLVGFAYAARRLTNGGNPYRLAALGVLVGIAAFSCVVFAGAFDSVLMLRIGAVLIGLGAGLFAVGTLTGAMALADGSGSGLALGAWGAVQATAAGVGIAVGGAIRDGVGALAASGALGPALSGPEIGYHVVYHLEILILFVSLVAIGPLVAPASVGSSARRERFGLADLPA